MLIESPPNAGKNLFFDPICHFYCNYGQIANFNRYQQFPLMDAINRRILIWNEPMCETSAFETTKMVFGGDVQKAKRKFTDDAVVDRIGIFVLCNSDIFPKDKTFRCRMFTYQWKQYDDLKYVKKKIFPYAVLDKQINLKEKYN